LVVYDNDEPTSIHMLTSFLAIKEKKELFLFAINSLSRSEEGNMETRLLLVLILNYLGKI